MSLGLVFLLVLIVCFAFVVLFTRPSQTDVAVQRRLKSLSEHERERPADATILKQERLSPSPWLDELLFRIPGTIGLLDLVKQRVVDYFGNTVILTTHILGEVENLCHRLAILYRGQLVVCDSVQKLKANSQIYDKYSLVIRNYPTEYLSEFDKIHGVISCSKKLQEDGSISMELHLAKYSMALSHILQCILQKNAEILRCSAEEPSFDEAYSAIIRGLQDNTP